MDFNHMFSCNATFQNLDANVCDLTLVVDWTFDHLCLCLYIHKWLHLSISVCILSYVLCVFGFNLIRNVSDSLKCSVLKLLLPEYNDCVFPLFVFSLLAEKNTGVYKVWNDEHRLQSFWKSRRWRGAWICWLAYSFRTYSKFEKITRGTS